MHLLPGKRFTTLNTIYHADAMDLLRHLDDNSVDMVLTDPPYGLGGRVFDFPHKKYTAINEAWDYEIPTQWMNEAHRVIRPGGSVACFAARKAVYVFGAEAVRLNWRIVNDVTWHKPDAPPNFTGRMMAESTERMLWFCPDGKGWTYNLDHAKRINKGVNLRDVWEFNTVRNGRWHPAQKPLALLMRVINLLSKPGDIILDPYMGSGTTAVAALMADRQYIGSELDAGYHAAAVRRVQNVDPTKPTILEDGTKQLSLFENTA